MNSRTLFVLFVVGGVLAGGLAGPASAHDTETVEDYEITFGGSDEPVITDERTWLEVEILNVSATGNESGHGDGHGTPGEPVEGLEDSLTIAVQQPFGNETHELDVDSRFGEPGVYEAPILFTEPGTYTVFVNGTIDGTDVALSFQKQVHDRSDLAYPTPSNDDTSSGSLTAGVSGIAIGAAIATLGMLVAFVAGRQL